MYANNEYAGVPRFDNLTKGEGGVIFKETFKSSSDLGGGVPSGAEGTEYSYSEDGITFLDKDNSRMRIVNVLTASERALMLHACVIGFTIDTAALNGDTEFSSTSFFLQTGGSQLNFKNNGGSAARLLARVGSTTSTFTQFRGSNARSKVVVYWTGKGIWLYIDNYLIAELMSTTAAVTAAELNDIYIGGRNSASDSITDHGISDFFIIADKHITMPILPRMRHINVYGDSKPFQGDYDSPLVDPTQAITARGEDSIGAGFAASNGNDDNLSPSIHRRLNAKGLYPGNRRLHMWAESQSGIIHQSSGLRVLQDRIDASLNGLYPIPNIAIIDIGTNDRDQAIDATWQGDYATAIEALRDSGCEKIILLTQIADNSGSEDDAKTAAMNNYIKGFESTYAEVTVVDAFSKSGGFNMPAAYTDDGVHPSVLLYQLEADWIADVIN